MDEYSADIAVIGAGIVGLSCALELMERGKSVTVLDSGDPAGRASFGNAGVISRGSIFPVAGPGVLRKLPRYLLGRDIAVRIRLASIASNAAWVASFVRAANETAWRKAAAALDPLVGLAYERHLALAAKVGAGHMIKRNGYLRLYRSKDAPAAARLERAILDEHGVHAELLGGPEVRELEPHLAPRFEAGLLFPESGSVESPGALVDAYARHLLARGGRIVHGTAETIQQHNEGVTVRTATETVRAGLAVIAAGARSGRLAAKLGYRFPLAAERGYHLHLRPRGNAVLNRPVHDAEGAYVMSPMEGLVRILSGVELAAPDDPPDETQLRAVLADARKSLPLEEAPDQKVWVGSRPSTPDGLPVIGFAPRHDRVLFAFGHGHIGLSTGPVTGLIVAQLAAGQRPALPIGPFSPARFGA
ncbi:FAD-binding oxidoreductase [Chelativorans sp.]|uniref:NAD(P)/FAD-dependent oxidoreductase n=1 Tax=Chelativorans sp. TaxID=2203393 RepID=UPI002811773D|nr:FAD-binding oxidoreductase [Chelativorans sp.]